MKVFISYSTGDTETVRQFVNAIEKKNHTVYWWSESQEPGKDAWRTIFEWIRRANIVLAVITDKTIARAMAVGNEIGYARAKVKRIVPILAAGIAAESIGCLIGKTAIKLDGHSIEGSIEKVLDAIDAKEAEDRKATRDLLLAGVAVLLLATGKQ